MTPDDIDLDRRIAFIPAAKGHPQRQAHIVDQLAEDLQKLKPRGEPKRIFGYQSRWSVYSAWRTACKRAEIRYVPPHQAGRHSFATEMIVRNGVDPASVAELGGWRSTRLLLDTYTHPDRRGTLIEEVFGKAKGQ